jgi:DNA-binding beta-propeller fold protein YncE
MNYQEQISRIVFAAVVGMTTVGGLARTAAAAEPYKVVASSQTMGSGGIDYVYADSEGRRAYVPRGNQIFVFDLDTLKLAGTITNSGGHGVAVDSKTHRGFSSSGPVTMFDTTTLEVLKKIPVQGRPDGILFEPATEKVYVLSHNAPNVTVLDPTKDGAIAGTIDLGGQPEQGASDGKGHVYIDLEDMGSVAVVDANTMKLTGTYSLAGKAEGPAGLGLDAKNHILFAMCRNPATCVILSADDGKIITTLPLAGGSDGGGFNPNTMEAFSSHGNATLSIIKENSPTSFEIEQTVTTKQGGKTCSLDTKLNHIIVIATERAPTPGGDTNAPAAPPAGGDQGPGPGRGRGGRGGGGPGFLDVLAIGR